MQHIFSSCFSVLCTLICKLRLLRTLLPIELPEQEKSVHSHVASLPPPRRAPFVMSVSYPAKENHVPSELHQKRLLESLTPVPPCTKKPPVTPLLHASRVSSILSGDVKCRLEFLQQRPLVLGDIVPVELLECIN